LTNGGTNRFSWFQSTADGTSQAINDTNAATANQWYHIAVVRDDVAKTVKLYVNGVQQGSTLDYTGKTVVNLQRSKQLGRSGPEFGDYFNGRIDELQVYGRALSPGEVHELAAAKSYAVGGTTIVADRSEIAGAAQITGAGTFSGTGLVSGSLTNSGLVAPGELLGCVTVNGNYTQSASGALDVALAGTTACAEHDQMPVNGVVTLGGELNVTLFQLLAIHSASSTTTAPMPL
jgi:hypothetical protein